MLILAQKELWWSPIACVSVGGRWKAVREVNGLPITTMYWWDRFACPRVYELDVMHLSKRAFDL